MFKWLKKREVVKLEDLALALSSAGVTCWEPVLPDKSNKSGKDWGRARLMIASALLNRYDIYGKEEKK